MCRLHSCRTGPKLASREKSSDQGEGVFVIRAQAHTSSKEKALRYDGPASGGTVNTYTWNARNQLTQVSQGGVVQLSYAYDAMGRRISKTVSGGTPTQFLYDGDNIVQEMQGSTINPILTGLAVDERFARNDVTGRTYFLTDALNSTIALTDTTGAIREQYSYDPYGNTTQSDTTTGFTNPYQYTGREADSPGLYYYRARYYSPVLGGMISEDPARFAGGQLSFYAYADGDPIDYTDPLGLMKLPADPSGLPSDWKPDPTHLDPNGSRWRDPEGNYLDFHKGRPGKPGWRGRNHWHYNGCDDHLEEGDEVPDAAPAPEASPEPDAPSQPYMPAPTPAAKAVTVGGVAVIVVIILLSPVGA